MIEYLLSSDSGNGPVIVAFDQRFHTGTSVPFLFFAGGHTLVGEGAILTGGPAMLASLERDPASLVGERFDLETIDLDELQGKPTIWRQDRVLLRSGTAGEGDAAKTLLLADDPAAMLAGLNYSPAEPQMRAGGTIAVDHAAVIGGGTLQWNGSAPAPGTGSTRGSTNGSASGDACPPPAEAVSLGAIVSLAAVDAIKPCAHRPLVVILVDCDRNRRTTERLIGGLFPMTVFICYLLRGSADLRVPHGDPRSLAGSGDEGTWDRSNHPWRPPSGAGNEIRKRRSAHGSPRKSAAAAEAGDRGGHLAGRCLHLRRCGGALSAPLHHRPVRRGVRNARSPESSGRRGLPPPLQRDLRSSDDRDHPRNRTRRREIERVQPGDTKYAFAMRAHRDDASGGILAGFL